MDLVQEKEVIPLPPAEVGSVIKRTHSDIYASYENAAHAVEIYGFAGDGHAALFYLLGYVQGILEMACVYNPVKHKPASKGVLRRRMNFEDT